MARDSFGYGTEQKPDLGGFLDSKEHKKWLNNPWDAKRDSLYLKKIIGMVHETFQDANDSRGEDAQAYIEIYQKILTQASQKDGAPNPQDIHQTLKEMQYGGNE